MKSSISLSKETIQKLAKRGRKGDTFEKIILKLLNLAGGKI